jgi:thiosulfate/3-mercaptopyruvate sulfurtransferase
MFDTIISQVELERNLQDPKWVIIDCRFSLSDTELGAKSYRHSHIINSHYAHLDRDLSGPIVPGKTGRHPLPDVDLFVQRLRDWGVSNDCQVIVYDDSNGGIASRLWWLLRWVGHFPVAVLDGGWLKWQESARPVSNLIPIVEPGDFVPDLRQDLLVDASIVEKIRQDKEWCLIDARAHERYLGLVEPIDPVAGHIEGAINHPFSENIGVEGFWKSPEELRKAFQGEVKNTVKDHTVFYCGSGVTACHNVLAYKIAGLGDALLYPGSWSEWINIIP